MNHRQSLEIRTLEKTDAGALAEFIRIQPPEYLRFFYAFTDDETALSELLGRAENDVYSGVFWADAMVGVFFLRGWDAGYETPSFGVLIGEKQRGRDFLHLTLDTAKLICRLRKTKRLMAKIHPDNVSPRGASRLGLKPVGAEEATGNIIYHLDL